MSKLISFSIESNGRVCYYDYEKFELSIHADNSASVFEVGRAIKDGDNFTYIQSVGKIKAKYFGSYSVRYIYDNEVVKE